MHMESPITGFASVDASAQPPLRFSKLGFSALEKPFTSRGIWLDSSRDTKVENTERQTFLTQYNFDFHNSHGYAAAGDGLKMIENGLVFVRPRMVSDGSFVAPELS